MAIDQQTTAFSKRELVSSVKLLLLEQQELDKNLGQVTTPNILRKINELIGTYIRPLPSLMRSPNFNCGVDGDGCAVTEVYAYPYIRDLAFIVAVTGEARLGQGVFEEIEVPERISFKGTDSAKFAYPNFGIVKKEWLGKVYRGNIQVPRPRVTSNNQSIFLSDSVYTTIRVTYKTIRYRYKLIVPAIEGATKNIFNSVFYGYYDGGVEWLEVKPPNGSDQFATVGFACGNPLTVQGPAKQPLTAPKADKETIFDYCSLAIKKDT